MAASDNLFHHAQDSHQFELIWGATVPLPSFPISAIVLAGHALQSDVVSNHPALNIQLVQIIEQVVGERIVVVDYKDHATADSELSVPESKKSLANGIKVET